MTSGVPGPNPAGANVAPVSHVDRDAYWNRYTGEVPSRSQVTELAHAATDVGRGFGGLTKDLAKLSLPDAHTGKPREIFHRTTGVDLHPAVADLRHAKSIGDEDGANRVLDGIVQQLSDDGFETSNKTRDSLRPHLERAAKIEDTESNGGNAPLTLRESVEDYYMLRNRAEDAKESYKAHHGRLRRAAVGAGRAIKNVVALPGTAANWLGAQAYAHIPRTPSKEAPADPERRKKVRIAARVGGMALTIAGTTVGTYFAHRAGVLDPLYDVANQAWDTVSEVAVDGYEAVEEWENVSEWVEGWFDDEPTAESGGNSGGESTSGTQQSETPTPESQPQQSETPAPDPSESDGGSTEPEQPQNEEPAPSGNDSDGSNNTPPPEETKPITIGDFETAQLGTYDGSTNDHTGYLNGTGYNSIAESLMQQSSQLGLDIDINELRAVDPVAFEDHYYDFVEGVLKDNGLTWEDARYMNGGETLTIKGERVTEYLTQSGITIPQEVIQDPQLPQGGSSDTGAGSGDSGSADGGFANQEDTGGSTEEESGGTGGATSDGNGEWADPSTKQDGQQGEQSDEQPQATANTETTDSGVPLVIIGASVAGAALLGAGGFAIVRKRNRRKRKASAGSGTTGSTTRPVTRTAPPPPPPASQPQPLPLPTPPLQSPQPPQGPPPPPSAYDPNYIPGGTQGLRRPGYNPDDDDDNDPPRYT